MMAVDTWTLFFFSFMLKTASLFALGDFIPQSSDSSQNQISQEECVFSTLLLLQRQGIPITVSAKLSEKDKSSSASTL